MANNRMFLVYRPTGRAIHLGKRMGFGWYKDLPDHVPPLIEALFNHAEEAALEHGYDQDDFVLAMEHSNSEYVFCDWVYTEKKDGPLRVFLPTR